MIIKSFEFKKTNIQSYNFYLFYGENKGLKKEIIDTNFKNKFKDETYYFEESLIIKNENDFFDEILTKSFFEKKKLIIISGITDKIKGIIEELFEKKIQDIFIILISDKLDKKSKLRSFFEKNKDLICVPFYPDNFQSLFYIADSFFKKIKIPISQEILNILINRANGDRNNLNNELIKIENFLKNKKKITQNDILKLTNLSENNSFSELVDNCLAKNQKKIIEIINENNFSSDDAIIIVRTFLSKAKRLLKINKEISSSKNLDSTLNALKPPIFWKDKDIVKKQIKNYSTKNTLLLINSINNAELQIKKNYDNSINILLDFIFSQVKSVNNKI
jgi:DNA polymerase III subunit delta